MFYRFKSGLIVVRNDVVEKHLPPSKPQVFPTPLQPIHRMFTCTTSILALLNVGPNQKSVV